MDFENAGYLSPSFMIPLVTISRNYRRENVNFEIVMPSTKKSALHVSNTNWAHLISPESYEAKGADQLHMSARQYLNPDEQFRAVDDSIGVMINSLEGVNRSGLQALEWALNEITDNVLNHANSAVGGIMQVVNFPNRRRVEFYVCDAGMTIPRSLRSGRQDITNDTSALRSAIEEGVTRNKQTNQGNGLFGTFKCCEVSNGDFDITSGMVSLRARPGELPVTEGTIPFPGTFVRASIGYDYEKLLERALVFGGKRHVPAHDFIDRFYQIDGETIQFKVAIELKAFGSREAGKLAHAKIEMLTESFSIPVEFDFENVRLITSSFADEVFGRIFESMGAVRFGHICRFKNVDSTIRALIDRAIAQRISQ
ncbi:STAS-like domain-containing protein [Devosia sp. MC532]|uniref:STAS-like domain-containing protein n=1 Tax=Devosia sp. MC532 TaxID=2799788 RepID=UPI0018F3D02C|nr:STAS-like domain-containing protein [Devosia sp. MC532]MBJ7577918.1 STAS-like domain-containing protein [Devosia sp. MC532]